MIEPIDLVEFAHDDELIAVGSDRSIIVEAIGKLGIATNLMRRLRSVRVTELWIPPRWPVIWDPGTFTIFSCA